MSEFGSTYSAQYDTLYQDKDYQAECDLIEAALRRFSAAPARTLLDLGCGTGSHALPLTERGYRVTGVDRSPEMLAIAARKAAGLPAERAPRLLTGDLKTLRLDETFDAALMMFAVLGYQLENADVLAALQAARHHLTPGGLFIFDVWYGPAVLRIRPSDRVKRIPAGAGTLLRAASGSLDTLRQTAEVRYHLWRFEGEHVTAESEESHHMRYFFPQELAFFLQQAGLEMLHLSEFGRLDSPPSEETWNVLGVARAV